LKLTIKKFYRASGASTQLKGVTPDIMLPSVANESKDIGESALENPLTYDTIPSAKYDKLNLVSPYVPELSKRSAQRVATDTEFAYVKEDIEQFKKAQADKTMSLNEKERLKEKEEAEARQKARDKERLARADTQEKVHELTLRQVNLPGLPPPVEKTNASLSRVTNRSGSGLSLVSTNSDSASVAATAPAIQPGDSNLDEDSEDDKPPQVDAALVETEHILLDYLSMLLKEKVLTAGH
jgi:carboxyl-terminal processing protease